MTSAELGENPYLEVALLSFTPDLILLIVIHWHRENFVSVTGARPIVLKLALCLWLQHYFCPEIKAVYNPTALTLVTPSIAIELKQKCLTSISGDCEHFLAGNAEDDLRRECWTKENWLQRFCGL